MQGIYHRKIAECKYQFEVRERMCVFKRERERERNKGRKVKQNTTSIRFWTCNTRILFLEFSIFSKQFHFNMNKWAKRGLKFSGGMGRLFVLSWCLMQKSWMRRFLLTIKADSPGILQYLPFDKKENSKMYLNKTYFHWPSWVENHFYNFWIEFF